MVSACAVGHAAAMARDTLASDATTGCGNSSSHVDPTVTTWTRQWRGTAASRHRSVRAAVANAVAIEAERSKKKVYSGMRCGGSGVACGDFGRRG